MLLQLDYIIYQYYCLLCIDHCEDLRWLAVVKTHIKATIYLSVLIESSCICTKTCSAAPSQQQSGLGRCNLKYFCYMICKAKVLRDSWVLLYVATHEPGAELASDQIQPALYFPSWVCLWASICLNKRYWWVNGVKIGVVKAVTASFLFISPGISIVVSAISIIKSPCYCHWYSLFRLTCDQFSADQKAGWLLCWGQEKWKDTEIITEGYGDAHL